MSDRIFWLTSTLFHSNRLIMFTNTVILFFKHLHYLVIPDSALIILRLQTSSIQDNITQVEIVVSTVSSLRWLQ